MASPIAGQEGLEESIDAQVEAVSLFTTIMPAIRFLLEHSVMY
jgi:hypothetical protein